jgi:hypothetical protein
MAKMTIWHGEATPLTAVGVNQCNLLRFLEKYQGWHDYAKDKATVRAVQGLLRRKSIVESKIAGLIAINDYSDKETIVNLFSLSIDAIIQLHYEEEV